VSAAGPDPALDPALLDGSAAVERLAARVEAAGSKTAGPIAAGNLWGSSQALLLAALARRTAKPLLVVTANESEADSFAADLAACGLAPLSFPARDAGSAGRGHVDPESLRLRLQAAQVLAGPPERRPRVVVAALLALMQPVPAPRELERKLLHLQVGAHLDVPALIQRLVDAGYTRMPLCERPGEISQRGDIVDVFPFAADLPLRIELFDDEVESLRTFEPESQRSLESLARTALSLISDAGGVEDGGGVQPLELFPRQLLAVDVEPLRIEDQVAGLRIQSSAHARALEELRGALALRTRLSLQSLPAEVNFSTRSVQSLSVGPKEAPPVLRGLAAGGARVVVQTATEGERHRFGELLGPDPSARRCHHPE
jgi:hypothetical protein